MPTESREAKRRVDFCENCAYWVNHTKKLSSGECRRHAPRANSAEESHWAVTVFDDWCGDYSPMLEPTK